MQPQKKNSLSIAANVTIPASVQLGADVSIQAGVVLTDALVIEDNVCIDAGVLFVQALPVAPTVIRKGVRIAAGAIIGAGVEIGWGASIEPGSVVLSSVPPNAVVQGNPARITGYREDVAADGSSAMLTGQAHHRFPDDVRKITAYPLGVGNAAVYQLPRITDMRGSLTVGEFTDGFPFTPQRYFMVFNVPSEKLRGEHAHKTCHEFLICVRGSCRALLDDGNTRREVELDRPDIGVHMPPMIWGTQYRYSRDAVLLVFASHPYETADYIRTYDEFQHAIRSSAS